jgi:hypothetical protein
MKQFYERPEVEEVEFVACDVITTSPGTLEDILGNDNPNGGWGGFE